jgi:hypothetical protein
MTRRVLILVALLLAIGFIAGHGALAHVAQQPAVGDPLTLTQPLVLSGPDVGFRVVRMDGAIPVGQIVVRINGVWMAAEAGK